MICNLFSEPVYFLFTSGVPALLYYAYIPTTIIALFVGIYVYLNGRGFLLNRLFLAIAVFFSLWTMSALIEWTNIHSNFILFVWNFSGVILGMVAILCIYFMYVFLEKKDIPILTKIIFLVLLAPVFFFSATSLNLSGFDITNCDAFKFESFPYRIYYTSLGVLAMVWVLVLLIRKYRIADREFRKQIFLMGAGIEFFLSIFFIWTFLIYYLTGIGLLVDSRFEMLGLLGMVIFMVYISILMVRFKTFNTKLLATQALIWGLAILVGSQFFFIKVTSNFILNGITFVGAIVFGQMLVSSVRKEIKQKEELAILNADLQNVIQQRESLMHLINHKVKGSFTHSKYIFAALIDGMFGTITPEVKKAAQMGLDSDNLGVKTIDLILNAANLQNGTVQYDMKSTSFKDILVQTIEEKKEAINKKGLELEVNIKEGDYTMNGDAFWLKEVTNNLIDNSTYYTKTGKIIVSLEKKDSVSPEGKKIMFSVKDTGIGITTEDKNNLFKEGGRGKESVKTNVNSTGYGLYSVKLIVEAHKGRVWAESEGKDKGSSFFVELNAI